MKKFLLLIVLSCFAPGAVHAYHGVASLGAAGLYGPGAPLETSASATLPRGSLLLYGKLDYARFEKYTPEVDDEGDYNAFWMYSVGYGFRSYLSLYAFVPFYTKTVEDNSYNTSGFADMSVMGVLGVKYDGGLNGWGEEATGGDIIYVTPALRVFLKSTSISAGVKLPVWTKLNEEDEPQGTEGKESYRAIVTLSVLL